MRDAAADAAAAAADTAVADGLMCLHRQWRRRCFVVAPAAGVDVAATVVTVAAAAAHPWGAVIAAGGRGGR